MILYSDEEIILLKIPQTIKGTYNESIYKGRYMKVLETGYWYWCQFRWGNMKRVKHVAQVERLEGLC